MTVNLHRWCRDTAAAFREMEHVEMAMYPTPEDRDYSLACWVIRVLGNPANTDVAEVLAAINEQRRERAA